MLKSAMKRHRFIRNTSFRDLKEDYELQNGPVFTEKLNLVLADPPDSTRDA